MGTHNGVASHGENVISTAERNFALKKVCRRRRRAHHTVVVDHASSMYPAGLITHW
ncbi:MAG TPA: hypothetical protein VKF14_21695 [Candidatus Dormibacteraeota bacterium]|nr:hypothetical protein [Candidatus Dormibacteraeota bacterium]